MARITARWGEGDCWNNFSKGKGNWIMICPEFERRAHPMEYANSSITWAFSDIMTKIICIQCKWWLAFHESCQISEQSSLTPSGNYLDYYLYSTDKNVDFSCWIFKIYVVLLCEGKWIVRWYPHTRSEHSPQATQQIKYTSPNLRW